MEAVATLGVASNVVQFANFGLQLCARIREYSAAAGLSEEAGEPGRLHLRPPRDALRPIGNPEGSAGANTYFSMCRQST